MTPQERQLVDELFDRLAQLEKAPRDGDAERAIADGLRRAPHAIYPLVQTVLIQDEALRRADARIREMGGAEEAAPGQGSFLDSMRSALGVRPTRTSVPSVATGQRGGDVSAPGSGGGSFLGTAAASAAGVIGGALLLNTISSMFGHHGGSAFAAVPPPDQDLANSDLARQAGIDHIGRSDSNGDDRSARLFEDDSGDDGVDFSDDFGGDFGGGDL